MALARTNQQVVFRSVQIKIVVKFQVGGLRKLEEAVKIEGLDVTCNIKNGLQETEACGLDCNTDNEASEEISSMELDPDTDIAGLPDDTDPTKLPITVDFSVLDNLKIIDDIPRLTINENGVNG